MVSLKFASFLQRAAGFGSKPGVIPGPPPKFANLVFFGLTPRVMAARYEALDETAIADEVAECRQRKVGGKWGDENGTPPRETPQAKGSQ